MRREINEQLAAAAHTLPAPANRTLPDLRRPAQVCIIGAGKMSKLLVKHLSSKGCSKITVLNRR